MPSFMARQILNWAEAHPRFRDGYAIGTGRWRALPFAINVLTHSRQRYRRNLRFYADDPTIRVGGPTYIGYAKVFWLATGVSRCG
ncbi:lysophospholipase L2 [Escherichia coli]|uniref:Lysophospholipase L2 n=1 Tax=Escherichia coli TaxID=562 RepID=A0A376TZE3_ECOLX|nr:lysophospholipase L2 [Escherichia coli]